MKRLSYDVLATGVLVLSAISIAGATLHREFGAPAKIERASSAPKQLPKWEQLVARGVLLGKSDAPVKIIEFADLECPYCRRFNAAVHEAQKVYGDKIALIFLHYPIRSHRFAIPAARATECAGDQGRFREYQDVVYSQQDSLGLKGWSAFASEAGVADTSRFIECTKRSTPVPRIEDGIKAGNEVGVHGTPTVIINGWLFAAPPYDSLPAVIENLMQGKHP